MMDNEEKEVVKTKTRRKKKKSKGIYVIICLFILDDFVDVILKIPWHLPPHMCSVTQIFKISIFKKCS